VPLRDQNFLRSVVLRPFVLVMKEPLAIGEGLAG